MGTSKARDLYFKKEIENQPTPEAYLKALAASPYSTHRKMALRLYEQYQQLKENQIDSE